MPAFSQNNYCVVLRRTNYHLDAPHRVPRIESPVLKTWTFFTRYTMLIKNRGVALGMPQTRTLHVKSRRADRYNKAESLLYMVFNML